MQKAKITIEEIAKTLNVSSTTVSLILNYKGDDYRISKKTQDRVFHAAESLGYDYKQKSSKNIRSYRQRSAIILCVFWPPQIMSTPLQKFLSVLYNFQTNYNQDFELILQSYAYGNLKAQKKKLEDNFYDCMLFLGLSDEDLEYLENNQFDRPIILYNRSSKRYNNVCIDSYEEGEMVMRIFSKHNHSNVAIIEPKNIDTNIKKRLNGFVQTYYMEHKNTDNITVIKDFPDDEGGYAAASRLLQTHPLPTALFVLSDNMIVGVVKCLKKHNIKIPDAMEIISCGNHIQNELISPSISSTIPPVEKMTIDCLNLVIASVSNNSVTGISKMYSSGYIARESCPKKNTSKGGA